MCSVLHSLYSLIKVLESSKIITVCVITYNHNEFISHALNSIAAQKTNFNYDILIADDCSTDGTKEKVLAFSKSRSNVSLILQESNVGPAKNFIELISTPKTKYISYLEGDDYWTDPYKLQKQVDYLEANPCVSCCATRFNEINNDAVKKTLFPNHKNIIKHDLVSVLNSKWLPVQTLTMVFRSDILQPKLHLLRNQKIYAGDYAMTVLLALKGDIHVLPDNTGNKRVDSGGVWESLHDSLKCRKLIETMDETSKFIPNKYKKLVAARITHHADYLLQDASTNGSRLIKTSIFLLKLHLRNLSLATLCCKYIFNFTRVKLGRFKPHLF